MVVIQVVVLWDTYLKVLETSFNFIFKTTKHSNNKKRKRENEKNQIFLYFCNLLNE
jgi:hypothetical protein